ncbi:MAG: PEP-CTERM sorting domain-containing protein [Deltaproteobacteria bacterium]|nr:PEP-CTERM sorting domain-containing protein [Deltaproteobacteria bacterium]
MKTALKILILSVLTFFLLGGSALAVSLSDNLPQNYFDTTLFGLKSVDYQMMPMNYSLIGKNLAANYDINNTPEDEVIDACDDETIATQWSSNYQIFHFATRALASYGSEVAGDADSCMFVGDIVELSTIPPVPVINSIASLPEPATIVLMGFGLFSLGGWARRLQKTKEI